MAKETIALDADKWDVYTIIDVRTTPVRSPFNPLEISVHRSLRLGGCVDGVSRHPQKTDRDRAKTRSLRSQWVDAGGTAVKSTPEIGAACARRFIWTPRGSDDDGTTDYHRRDHCGNFGPASRRSRSRKGEAGEVAGTAARGTVLSCSSARTKCCVYDTEECGAVGGAQGESDGDAGSLPSCAPFVGGRVFNVQSFQCFLHPDLPIKAG
jgi:hypothetical protein